MKMIYFIFLFFFCLSNTKSQASEPLQFSTSDQLQISADFYPRLEKTLKKPSLIIVAPGFAQNKNTTVMKSICQSLATEGDVLCFDFRGTGASTGVYNFGASEYLDLEPILTWGSRHYSKINLIGLSLGAYTSLRAAHQWPTKISRLLLISCPTDLVDIIASGGMFWDVFNFMQNLNDPELKTGADWTFRWGSPFVDEPNLEAVAPSVSTPAAFLVGDADPLVGNALSLRVFNAYGGKKSWNALPGGDHAEAMYVQNPSSFIAWITAHLAR